MLGKQATCILVKEDLNNAVLMDQSQQAGVQSGLEWLAHCLRPTIAILPLFLRKALSKRGLKKGKTVDVTASEQTLLFLLVVVYSAKVNNPVVRKVVHFISPAQSRID